MKIAGDELIEVLQHWKEARETRLNEIEVAENLRCAIDLVKVLSDHGLTVPVDLWRLNII